MIVETAEVGVRATVGLKGSLRRYMETFDLSVRLRHKTGDLTKIAKDLGLVTTHAWKDADRITGRDGGLTGSFYSGSYLSSKFVTAKDLAFFDVTVESCLADLCSHKLAIHAFIADGGFIELWIGWFFNRTSGLQVKPDTLAHLAELGLTLSIMAYGEPD